MSKRQQLEQVEQAMAAHPKGMPLNDRGQLVPDPVPMAPPIGYRPQPSMVEIIRNQVRLASLEAERQGLETEDQADDFDVGDDDQPTSPYEIDTESEVPLSVLRARAQEAEADYLAAKRDAGDRMRADAAKGPSEVPKAEAEPPEGVGPGSPAK